MVPTKQLYLFYCIHTLGRVQGRWVRWEGRSTGERRATSPPSPASLPGPQMPQGQLLRDEEESGQEVRWPQPRRLPWKVNGGSPPRPAFGLCPPSQGAGDGQRWHGSTATAWFGSPYCPGPSQMDPQPCPATNKAEMGRVRQPYPLMSPHGLGPRWSPSRTLPSPEDSSGLCCQ